jgi:hypothetical protein
MTFPTTGLRSIWSMTRVTTGPRSSSFSTWSMIGCSSTVPSTTGTAMATVSSPVRGGEAPGRALTLQAGVVGSGEPIAHRGGGRPEQR